MNLAKKPLRFPNITGSDPATATNVANTKSVYESLKGVVQQSLQRSKAHPMALPRLEHSDALRFNEGLEELERIVADRLARLKAAVNEGEAAVSSEAHHAEQVNEGLNTRVAVLEAKLQETEDTVRRKDSDNQRTAEALTVKIRDLQSEIEKKHETLEKRESEITDLKTQKGVLTKRTTESEAMIEQAKAAATAEAARAEHIAQTSQSKISALETQLTTTEEMVRKKESAITAMEQEFSAKIQELESQLINKDKLLVGRLRQINDLTSQLKSLEDSVRKMSSFFKPTEPRSAIAAQAAGAVLPVVEPKSEEKPAVPQFNNPAVGANKTDDAAPETVSTEFFGRMTAELSDLLGPMASMIIRHDAMALGESMDKFPKARVTELLDSITKEISDEKLKNAFLKRFGS
jgi:myosin heavy subunit